MRTGPSPLQLALEANANLMKDRDLAARRCSYLLEENTQLVNVIREQRSALTSSMVSKAKLGFQLRSKESQLDSAGSKLDAHSKLIDERAEEIERMKLMDKAHKRASTKALSKLQEMERLRMAQLHEAQAQHCAATFVQAHERRRRAAAEVAAMQAKERLNDEHKLSNTLMVAAQTAVGASQISQKYRGQHMTLRCDDGKERSIKEAFSMMLNSQAARVGREGGPSVDASKYVRELVLGRPEAAALGIVSYLKVDLFELFGLCTKGVDAIRAEWMANGTEDDKECVQYVLDKPAGKDDKMFVNGQRDRGRKGELLCDFARMHEAQTAQLTEAHIAAVRIYTTACFHSINDPLREAARTKSHPFPTTVFFLTDAIKRLRAIHLDSKDVHSHDADAPMLNLWRGMKNVETSTEFELNGGSEAAPMSTTSDPAVAVAYGQSAHSLLFKIVAKSFMTCGADISWLSAFPGEREYLCVSSGFQPVELSQSLS